MGVVGRQNQNTYLLCLFFRFHKKFVVMLTNFEIEFIHLFIIQILFINFDFESWVSESFRRLGRLGWDTFYNL